MNGKAAMLGLTGLAVMPAACSNPSPPASKPAESAAARPARAWRQPIVATTTNNDVMSYMARLTGRFEIIDGCLSFITGDVMQRPVFGRTSPPVPGPDGVTWGRRKFEYGREYSMGGGQAPAGLEINDEAHRNCPGEFVVIAHASTTREEVLARERFLKQQLLQKKQR